jgi:hypothetical protein
LILVGVKHHHAEAAAMTSCALGTVKQGWPRSAVIARDFEQSSSGGDPVVHPKGNAIDKLLAEPLATTPTTNT